LGVSRDSIESHNQFVAKFNLPFVLLSDPQTEVMKTYGAWGPRQNAEGKTVEGVIRSTALIAPDGTVKRHWIPVSNAEAHPAEVLEYLSK
jgi:peroxiredoxin Q/BCP